MHLVVNSMKQWSNLKTLGQHEVCLNGPQAFTLLYTKHPTTSELPLNPKPSCEGEGENKKFN